MKTPASLSLKALVNGTVIGLCLAGFGISWSQETAKPKRDPIASQGCVWKLSDGDNTVYLAGSVHLLREDDYPLPIVFDQAYADSDRLIFEIDMADMTSVSAALEMQKLGSYPPNESLQDYISDEAFERIVEYFKSRRDQMTAAQMSPAVISRFKPGMIFLTISGIEAQRLGAKAELGLELQYFQRSKFDDKPSTGLETIAYQMARFEEFTREEIETLIMETLDQLDEMPETTDRIINAWHLGDTAELDKLMNEQMDEENRLRELLLTERNKNWIPHIEKALEGGENTMFIVGAAHLVGKDSVVDLLRKKGYTVERVKSDQVAGKRKKAA